MLTGLLLVVFAVAACLILLGRRSRKAGRRHELELQELRQQLNELSAAKEALLIPVLQLAERILPLAELAENHGRSELYWHHRAALRLAVVWAKAILKDPISALPVFSNNMLFAVALISKRQLEAAEEIVSELWLMDRTPRVVKLACLSARVEMYKVGGFYIEAQKAEAEMAKLSSLDESVPVLFQIT